MMDTGIAARLRGYGIPVVEVDGWQSRGSSSFDPRGSVNHHTAGSSSGATPSLNTCIYGRSDLPGPLCHVMQSREPDGNDKAYVIAAGRANHAGEGGWSGLSGNSSVYGLEIEHTGTSSISEGRRVIASTIHAALIEGRAGADRVCQHSEWAPSRKIDLATEVDGNGFRQRVANALAAGGKPDAPEPPLPPPPEGYVMYLVQGDNAIALAGAGYWRTCPNMEEVNAFQALGMKVWRVNQRQYDVVKNACLNPSYASWTEG
jgi:hypothetical protein